MKKTLVASLTFFVLLILVAAAPVRAQSVDLTADIPFQFEAGTASLPAGHYTVKSVTPYVLLLRNQESNAHALVTTRGRRSLDPRDQGELIFNRYGNRYFLSQIWSPGSVGGREVPASRLERELRAAAEKPQQETTILAVR